MRNSTQNRRLILIPVVIFVLLIVQYKVKEVLSDINTYRTHKAIMLGILKQEGIGGGSTEQIVTDVRRWVHKNSLWGFEGVESNGRSTFNRLTAYEMYKYVQNKSNAPLDCGSYTVFMSKVLEYYGIRAYILDFGKESDFAHSVVLVKLKTPSSTKWILEDPTYNLVFSDKNNNPIDFFSLLSQLRVNRNTPVVLNQNPADYHVAVCKKNGPCDVIDKKRYISSSSSGERVYYKNRWELKPLKDNIQSLLQLRQIRYYDRNREIFPFQKALEVWILEGKIKKIIN